MSAIKDTRGSVIIAALIVTIVTGALIGLFLQTVTQEVENSYRARMSFQAVNLAEAGLDWAMYSLIKDDWSNWTEGANGYYRDSFPDITYSWHNERRVAKVYVEPDRVDGSGNTLPPLAIAEGSITLRNGITVTRQVFVELTSGASDDPTKGGWFGNGILGKIGLKFGGNKQTIDSFHTGVPGMSVGQSVADYYASQTKTTILGDTLANPKGSAASMSASIDDIILGNADIYGTLASGDAAGTNPDDIFGPNGSIYDDASADPDNAANWKDNIDYGNIAMEFKAELPDVTAPTITTASSVNVSVSNKQTMTIDDSSVGTDLTINTFSVGKGGTLNISGDMNLKTSSVSISGDTYIKGNIVMVIDGDLDIGGLLEIQPYTDSSGNSVESTVELYVSGDIDLGGNGIANTGLPENLIIYHTQTEADAAANGGKTMKLHGTAPMSAAVYAPNVDITMDGGGTSGAFYGAVVGNSVTFRGNNYDFHYDEALADIGGDPGDPNDDSFIPEVSVWVELTDASDKRNMATILTDGL